MNRGSIHFRLADQKGAGRILPGTLLSVLAVLRLSRLDGIMQSAWGVRFVYIRCYRFLPQELQGLKYLVSGKEPGAPTH